MKDTLYKNLQSTVKPFEFDQHVVDVFPDMIKRSVPGYPMTLAMISVIADRYFIDGTSIYDLGCSIGAVSFALDNGLTHQDGKIIGIDNSEAMIASCHRSLELHQSQFDIEFIQADVTDFQISNASVVVMNFTLQFIPLEKRYDLLKRIYEGMLPGGVLIISEKIAFAADQEASLMQEMHHHMKAMNGYDDMEIANKRDALEKVLIPENLDTHFSRLEAIGFQSVTQWLRCLNFVSVLAFKPD
ncbi:MAG: carboxy-S-adenosyl-L-methionine synthase CmoA [Pseudomonadota bacterium]